MPTKKKSSVKKAPAKKASVRVTAKETSAKKTTTKTKAAKPKPATAGAARPGDLIVIDSPKVGSPPRQGEVLEVIQGEVRVSYRVQWTDGHQTLIAPVSGSARIVPA